MIKKLSLKNFKVFEEKSFEFGKLNVLSGLNSSGKSSVIQAIHILKEKDSPIGFTSLVDFIREDFTGFKIEALQDKDLYFSYERNGKNEFEGDISGIVSYISADRHGPKVFLQSKMEQKIETVGMYGENIVDFLNKLDNAEYAGLKVPEQLSIDGNGLMQNIKEWLRFISPRIDFDIEKYEKINVGRTKFNQFSSIHVGFGLSYILPIIASIIIHSSQLKANMVDSVILLIENPEAHLHPSGQTMIGKMLSYCASCGVQVFVETHSDHLLNGVRLATKQGNINSNDVRCYFFKGNNENNSTSVEQISIDKYGMIDYWPDGFFDESEKNIMELI